MSIFINKSNVNFKQQIFEPDEICDGEHANKFLFAGIPKRASSNSGVHHCKKCLKYLLSGHLNLYKKLLLVKESHFENMIWDFWPVSEWALYRGWQALRTSGWDRSICSTGKPDNIIGGAIWGKLLNFSAPPFVIWGKLVDNKEFLSHLEEVEDVVLWHLGVIWVERLDNRLTWVWLFFNKLWTVVRSEVSNQVSSQVSKFNQSRKVKLE